jgi:hypothetical protein
MQHSPESVRAPYLGCDNPSLHSVHARADGKVLLTCDVITRLHQRQR